ncbi:MAG: alpha/beta hydrolase [Chloroflexi bacterium]|nr:alpha/beta hydrolase [Chloroflexota bacterium]
MTTLVPDGVVAGALPLSGRSLSWVEAGSGRPTVVLEAGAGATAIDWAPVIGALAAQTHVVAYDRAGLGSSDRMPWLPTIDRQVDDLAAVIGRTGGGTSVIVGHSWGGLLVQALAFQRPELVAGIVLVDPYHEELATQLPGPLRALVRFANDNVILRVPPLLRALGLLEVVERRFALHSAQQFIEDPGSQRAIVDAYVAGRVIQAGTGDARRDSRAMAASLPMLRQMRAKSSFPRVPLVVLSASGGFTGGLRQRWTMLQGRVAAAAGGKHIVVANSGHVIQRDRPDAVVEAIVGVVNQVREAGLVESG